MSDLTEQLAEIKARAEAATEGPWEWTAYRVPTLEGWKGDPAVYRYQTEVLEADHNGECGCRSACQLDLTIAPSDAKFIAHAREDIPRLIAAVDAVLAIHRETYGECSSCIEPCGCGCEGTGAAYPCPTVRVITAALAGES